MKKHKHKHHEEHVDESWLIPYADLLTLLLALFIVLFATSQSDKKKMEQMAEVFTDILSGQTGIMDSMAPFRKVKPDTGNTPDAPAQTGDKGGGGAKAAQEETDLIQLKNDVDEFSKMNSLPGYLSTSITGEGLMISIKSVALFSSGSSALMPEADRIAAGIAELLENYDQSVVVAGHTDDVPSGTVPNWDLSSARALSFMKEMLNDPRLNPARFSSAGYGEYHPIVPNITEENRQLNRRVEVLVKRKFPMPPAD
jgi:chemotaxis protein MotB